MAKKRHLWRRAALSAGTIAGLAALKFVATAVFAIPQIHGAARFVAVMSSLAVIDDAAVVGYYERLFDALGFFPMFQDEKEFERWAKRFRDRTCDRSFRIFRLKPNLRGLHDPTETQGLTTNSFGFLGPERSLLKPQNTRRVALLGDSNTQGLGADQSQSWAALFEKRLNETHPSGTSQRFEILNFSVPGYVLTQMLDVTEEDAPRFEPDVYMLALTERSIFQSWDEHFVHVIQLRTI